MAYYDDNDQEQLDPNAVPGQQTSNQSAVISGQGSSPGQGSPSQTPDSPGNFVGIQQYLDANQPQAAKLGDQVAGQVQSTIQGANEDVGALQGKFETLANQGQISNIGNANQDAQNISQKAATGAQGQNITDEDKSRFGQIANAQYQGPDALMDTELYQPAYAKLQDAQKYADLSKNESGTQQLLKDIFKQPNYSQGANRFDSYLLSSDENRAKLAQAREDAQGLQDSFSAADKGTSDYATQQKTLADQARLNARQGLSTTQTQRNQEVKTDLDNIQATWNDEQQAYADKLFNSNGGQNLQITDDMMAKLGVTADQRIYNILKGKTVDDIKNQYLTMQEFDANKVISKDQQAQLAALDELAGLFGGDTVNQFTQSDLAGTLTRDQALDGANFGRAADEAKDLFSGQAKMDNLAAFRDYYDPGYGYVASANVDDYLNRGNDAIGLTAHSRGQNRDQISRRYEPAKQLASNALVETINNYLQQAGYNNQIKKS